VLKSFCLVRTSNFRARSSPGAAQALASDAGDRLRFGRAAPSRRHAPGPRWPVAGDLHAPGGM